MLKESIAKEGDEEKRYRLTEGLKVLAEVK
jgi:hypothetical protein